MKSSSTPSAGQLNRRPKGRQGVDAAAVEIHVLREGADAPLILSEAVALIAARVMQSHDDTRGARNRVRTQMTRSLKKGGDVTAGGLARLRDGRFTADEIRRWATAAYPDEAEKFSSLPFKPRKVSQGVVSIEGRALTTTSESVTPGDIAACQAEVRGLRKENADLKARLELAEAGENRRRANNFKGSKKAAS